MMEKQLKRSGERCFVHVILLWKSKASAQGSPSSPFEHSKESSFTKTAKGILTLGLVVGLWSHFHSFRARNGHALDSDHKRGQEKSLRTVASRATRIWEEEQF